MLMSVLMMSLGLFVRNSVRLVSANLCHAGMPPTWASIDRLWFPIRIRVIVKLGLLERLYGFILINE